MDPSQGYPESAPHPSNQGMTPVPNNYSQQPYTPIQPPKRSRRTLYVGLGIGLFLIIGVVVIIVIAFNSGVQQDTQDEQASTQSVGPQPAREIDIRETNNALGQEVGGFNNDADFSDDALSNTALGL